MASSSLVGTIHAEPLTAEAFRPFGAVIAGGRADVQAKRVNRGTATRYGWLDAITNLRPGAAKLNLSIFRCAPREGSHFTVEILEKHPSSSQIIVPMNAERWLVVVAAGASGVVGDVPDPTTLRAFLASGREGVSYAPGTWHHPIIALGHETDFTVLAWEDVSPGDCTVVTLAEADRVTIAIGSP